jgi:4-amino-4-deoxy-L-arabinose transferase-like glycosyltransferase
LKKYFIAIDNLLNKRSGLLFWIVIFLIVSGFFYLNILNYLNGSISNGLPGIKYWLDTGRYLGAADNIISGLSLQGREIQFSGYILLISLIKVLNLPLISIVVIQIAVALTAAFLMLKCVEKVSKSKIAAVLSFFLFLCNPFIVRWHLYILTESLYTSMVLICLILLYYAVEKKTIKYYLLSFAFLLITISLRPNAWILLPLFFVSYVSYSYLKKHIKIVLAILFPLVFILAAAGISGINNSIMITSPIDNLQKGVTVWGHDELNMDMPKDSVIDKSNWTAGFEYVVRYPIESISLAFMRVWYSVVHIRPYHSLEYKIHVLLWIIPAYILSVIALLVFWKEKIVKLAFWFIVAHLIVVALSYAEHDSRFDTYILPVFYLLAGIGIAIRKNNTSHYNYTWK